MGSLRRNRGLRLDHIWGTAPRAERSISCKIHKEERPKERPSDHAPMIVTIAPPVD